MKTLHLTLSEKPFEVMVNGEKRVEFRKPSDWIKSRLFDKNGNPKQYDFVKFVNGYGSDKPYFICEYKGFCRVPINKELHYSNGLKIEISTNDFMIILGKIIERGNHQS